MKECDKVRRKIRTKDMWLPREDGFICGRCNAKGDCVDSLEYDLETTIFYWDDKEQKIICRKCGKWLTDKTELEEKVKIREIQTYGFWLRFASEHFIPCNKCQDKLHNILTKNKMTFLNSKCITMMEFPKKKHWIFILWFLETSQSFTPCKKCQPKILKKIDEKELHIGSDGKPLVELWRKWDIIDEPAEIIKEIKDGIAEIKKTVTNKTFKKEWESDKSQIDKREENLKKIEKKKKRGL